MNDLFERVLLLKKVPMFAEVNTSDLRFVVQNLEEEWYFAGERVFDIHDQGDHMYFVMEGEVGISTDADPRRREYVKTLGPGSSFGEMHLLDKMPRSATVHVLVDTRLLSLEKTRLRGLIMSYPEIGLGLLKSLSLRLREIQK